MHRSRRTVLVGVLIAATAVGAAAGYAASRSKKPTQASACVTKGGALTLQSRGRCAKGLTPVMLPLTSVAGQHGALGATGPTGPSGPTTLTQAPAWAVLAPLPAGQANIGAAQPLDSPNGSAAGDQVDFWNIDNTSTTAANDGSTTLATYLLSPSQISGSTAHLGSIEFCWGTDTSVANNSAASLTITRATVVQYDEPATPASGTYYAPSYTAKTLLDSPLNLANGAGCQTVASPAPVAIDPNGFLKLQLGVSWSMPKTPQGAAHWTQVTLELGRVTATYTP